MSRAVLFLNESPELTVSQKQDFPHGYDSIHEILMRGNLFTAELLSVWRLC